MLKALIRSLYKRLSIINIYNTKRLRMSASANKHMRFSIVFTLATFASNAQPLLRERSHLCCSKPAILRPPVVVFIYIPQDV